MIKHNCKRCGTLVMELEGGVYKTKTGTVLICSKCWENITYKETLEKFNDMSKNKSGYDLPDGFESLFGKAFK